MNEQTQDAAQLHIFRNISKDQAAGHLEAVAGARWAGIEHNQRRTGFALATVENRCAGISELEINKEEGYIRIQGSMPRQADWQPETRRNLLDRSLVAERISQNDAEIVEMTVMIPLNH